MVYHLVSLLDSLTNVLYQVLHFLYAVITVCAKDCTGEGNIWVVLSHTYSHL